MLSGVQQGHNAPTRNSSIHLILFLTYSHLVVYNTIMIRFIPSGVKHNFLI